MFNLVYHHQFQKDVQRSQKRGKDLSKLKQIIKMLAERRPLPLKYRDHRLLGEYKGRRECHIEPDWLLIYKLTETEIVFERLGTHADLFG